MIINKKNFIQSISDLNNQSSNGSVISFFYENYKHDPWPVIIMSGIDTSRNLIYGLNLHYLPFPIYYKFLNKSNDQTFNYESSIRNEEQIIKNAFRSYKMIYIKRPKKINYKAIITALSMIRNFSPEQIYNLKKSIDEQVMGRAPEILNEILGGGNDNGL